MNGLNGIQREAQWKPDPFDTPACDFLSSSSTPWHTTQSLTRGSSLRTPPSLPASKLSSNTLPSSFSLQSSNRSDLQALDSSSSSSLSTPSPFASSLLPPPPVASRSRSQETLRASPGPFLTDPLPARPSSTNPFTGPLAQQHRSLTPDSSVQRPSPTLNLQGTMPALTQPLIPTSAPTAAPAAAPTSQLQRTMSLFGPSSTLNPTPAPLFPLASEPSPAPALPLALPSSLPQALAPRRQPPPPGRGRATQQWVTFDDDFPPSTKTTEAPIFHSSSLLSQTQTLPFHSAFDSEPEWLSSTPSVFPNLPPSVPTRIVTSNPKLPEGPRDDCFFPRESTES